VISSASSVIQNCFGVFVGEAFFFFKNRQRLKWSKLPVKLVAKSFAALLWPAGLGSV
jgi:hypothetical protein